MKTWVGIVAYGERNQACLSRVLELYGSMRPSPDVVVVSNVPRKLPGVEVAVRRPPDDPRYFPYHLRALLADQVGRYELYVASEDDVAVTARNVEAFVEAAAEMPDDAVPGFLRYERTIDGAEFVHDVHGPFGWVPGSTRRFGPHTAARYENLHSAAYMLTDAHLRRAVSSGRMLEMHRPSGRYGVLEAATTHLYERCGLTKWFVLSRAQDFLLHHLTDRYAGDIGVARADFDRYVRALLDEPELPSGRLLAMASTDGRFDRDHFEPVDEALLEALGRPRRALWVGSGAGATELRLAERGTAVTCIPLDAVHGVALAQLGLRTIGATTLEGALERAEAGGFDAVVLPEVLERLPDPVETLRRAARRLAPGGRLWVTAPNHAQRRGVTEPRAVRADLRPIGAGLGFSSHGVHFVSARSLEAWCAAAGLRASIQHHGRGLRRLRRLARGGLDAALAPRLLATVWPAALEARA